MNNDKTDRYQRGMAHREYRHATNRLLSIAARAAHRATLPPDYQWGADALEAFNFGKEQAAKAIERMKIK